MKKYWFSFFIILILTACNSTKHLVENEFLLEKNVVFIDSSKTNATELQKFILQKPNNKLLGFPFGVYMHNLGKHKNPKSAKEWGEKNPKSYNFVKNIFSEKQSIAYANMFINFNNWLLDFEEPVKLDIKKVSRTVDNLKAHFNNQGFFKTKVKSEIVRDSATKKTIITYHITKNQPLLLDSIKLDIQSNVLDSIYKASKHKSLLVKGNQYNDATFRREAKNVVKMFRDHGIYNFTDAAIGFHEIDTASANNKTDVDYIIAGTRLSDENGQYVSKPYKIHKIKEVNVFTDYNFEKRNEIIKDSATYNNVNFYAYDNIKYNLKYLSQSIFLRKNSIYKDTLNTLTRNHLRSLKNFKTTNITFTPYTENEEELIMNVYLNPTEKYTLGFDSEITHSNIRNIGVSGKFSITNRNTFKGAELLKLSLFGSWFNSNNGPGYEIGTDASIEVPRFVVPFGLSRFVPKEKSPKTLFSIGTSLQKNIGLDRQTFSFLTDYSWQFSPKKTIHLEILNTQYVKNLNVGGYFDIYRSEFSALNEVGKIYSGNPNFQLPEDNTKFDTTLQLINTIRADTNFASSNPEVYNTNLNVLNRFNIITSDFLIPIIGYSFTYNSQLDYKNQNYTFFRIRFANSGNILGLLSNKTNANGKKTFADIPLAQYFKTDIEYKQFWSIGETSVFGFRTFLGAIFTYDNSDIPFIKSYFAGGSNDIRAWQTYDLGPGSRNTGLEFNVGSLKFLTSAEYRFDVFSKLKGAIFMDAGNIWDITGSDLVDDASKFNGFSSLQDIAIGTGFGARVDFGFLVIRLDVGFKTYEPYLYTNKWFSNYNFSKAVYNIGINYPF